MREHLSYRTMCSSRGEARRGEARDEDTRINLSLGSCRQSGKRRGAMDAEIVCIGHRA